MLTGALVACTPSAESRFGMAALDDAVGKIAAPLQAADDPSVFRTKPNAHTKIYLSSNKQTTSFTINGYTLPSAKSLAVMVLADDDLHIVATAPCYKPQIQDAPAGNYAQASLFQFTFANWNKNPDDKSPNCQ